MRKRNIEINKKIYMYIASGIVVLILVEAIIYLALINKDNDNNTNNKIDNDIQDNNSNSSDSFAYVSCDANTALLNVRNSTSGDIIDGLSCYKMVNIEQELEGNDACDNWYKISYVKRGNNYTGYACGTYIKKSNISEDVINKIRGLIDKANSFYVDTTVKPYCGNTSDSREVTVRDTDGNLVNLEYVKSEYKTIEDLKKYVASFIDPALFKNEFKVGDINSPKIYDNYYDIDGELYCRDYDSKNEKSKYTNNYDIEVVSDSDNKYVINISYEYLNDDSKCDIDNLEKCSNGNFRYELGKITIENNVITKMDFHK